VESRRHDERGAEYGPILAQTMGNLVPKIACPKLDIISCRDGEAENGYHRCANAVTFEATRRISGDLIHEVDGRVQ